MNKLGIYINLKTSFMKRLFFFIICLTVLLVPSSYSQESAIEAGLSLETYQLPTYRTGFTNYSSSNYYQPVFGKQKSIPSLVLNQQKLKRDKIVFLLANTLNFLDVSRQPRNFGTIGLQSPTFDPLVTALSSPNDYLLLQQHESQRNKKLPTFITAPRALQIWFH